VSNGLLPSAKKGTLFFDLETQHSFEEVGGRNYVERLHVSVAVTYSSLTKSFKSYTEPQVFFLIEELFQAETIIGFNIIDFDYRVLKPYTAKDFNQLHTIDMLAHIKRRLGHRLSLNALAQATLSADKSADGLQAVTWYRQGKIPELISYCKDDVDLTRRLYEFGKENGYLLYHDRFSGETKKVPVEW
jgi:DEAD/DEAH box helicase domain-containing protein